MPLPNWARSLGLSQDEYESMVDAIWAEDDVTADEILDQARHERGEQSGVVFSHIGVSLPEDDDEDTYGDDWGYPDDDPTPDTDIDDYPVSFATGTTYSYPVSFAAGTTYSVTSDSAANIFEPPWARSADTDAKPKVFIDRENRVRICKYGSCCAHTCNGQQADECPELPGFTARLNALLAEASASRSSIKPEVDGMPPKPPEGRHILRDVNNPDRKIIRKKD
jgi:hypothetical protein